MKYLLGLLLLTGLLGAGCTRRQPTWPDVLDTLNARGPKPELFPQTVETNLLQVYDQELAGVKAKWEANPQSLSNRKAKKSDSRIKRFQQRRKLRNALFHEEIEALNQSTYLALDKIKNTGSPGNYRKVAAEVLTEVHQNPVAQLESSLSRGGGGQIGFCFGRALLIHYLLLKSGVKPQDIVKVFALGQLKVGDQFWRFHVAVWVRDAKDGFIVLDPLQTGIMPSEQWLSTVRGYAMKYPTPRIRFYASDPRKFLPAYGKYHINQIHDPHLRAYFDGLLGTLPPS